jgi:hypothetical protein
MKRGHQIPAIGAEEIDMLSPRSRRMLSTPHGRPKAAKKKYNKRDRRHGKLEVREETR